MSDTTVSMDTLRHWLDQGRPVTVLDVRPSDQHAEWAIPGSVHVDAYEALKSNDPDALLGVRLPQDRPVVTVCLCYGTHLGDCGATASGSGLRSIQSGWWNESLEPGLEFSPTEFGQRSGACHPATSNGEGLPFLSHWEPRSSCCDRCFGGTGGLC